MEPHYDIAFEIARERGVQITEKSWTPEHDDQHSDGAMVTAAVCYAEATLKTGLDPIPPATWPWHSSWWKPTSRRRALIKACALLVAEIERLDRIALAMQQRK